MKSMTGYGYAEVQAEAASVSVELKSYNNRFLDLVISVPSAYSALEQKIRDHLGPKLTRGRVEVYVKVRESEGAGDISLDEGAVRGYMAALDRLRELAGLDEPARLSDLLQIEGIFSVDRSRDPEKYWELLAPILEQAYGDYDATRAREGESTRRDVEAQLGRIEEGVGRIEQFAPAYEAQLREMVRARFAEVMEDAVDENRVYSETAALLVRYSINEEIVRLRSHLDSFREILAHSDDGNGVGKKLDFICQELNREINTTGSKSTMVEINRIGVEIKDAIENIREQLRNVE